MKKWIVPILIAFAIISGVPILKQVTKPDNDIALWFHQSDPDLLSYRDHQKVFGNDRIISIALHDSVGVLTKQFVDKLVRLTTALKALQNVADVSSIIDAKDVVRQQDGLVTRIKFLPVLRSSNPTLSDSVSSMIQNSSLFVGRLINREGTSLLVHVRLKPDSEINGEVGEVIENIKSISRETFPEGCYISGMDVIVHELNKLTAEDIKLFMGIAFLLMLTISTLFLKKFTLVFYALYTTIAVAFMTLMVFGLLGYHLNIFTVLTIPLVVILSLMNCMHVSAYLGERARIIDVCRPLLFGFVTTVIGFSSLCLSQVRVMQEFGLFACIGSLFSYGLPLVMGFSFQGQSLKKQENDHDLSVAGFIGLVLKRKRIFVAIMIAITVVMGFGISKVKRDMNILEYFPDDHAVVKTNNYMELHWRNYLPTELVLASRRESFFSPALAGALHRFDKAVQHELKDSSTFTMTTVLDRFAEVGAKTDLAKILQQPFASGKMMKTFRESLDSLPNLLATEDGEQVRYVINTPYESNVKMAEKLLRIKEIGHERLPEGVEVNVVGFQALFLKSMDAAFEIMRNSLLSASVGILILMFIFFKDIRLALIALLPNLFPVLIIFGIMGFAGMNLDLATCSTGAVFIGIALDDTIHILYHFKKSKGCGDEKIINTYRLPGKVFLQTALMLMGGFALMIPASVTPVSNFGVLAVAASISAIIGDLVLMPLLLRFTTSGS